MSSNEDTSRPAPRPYDRGQMLKAIAFYGELSAPRALDFLEYNDSRPAVSLIFARAGELHDWLDALTRAGCEQRGNTKSTEVPGGGVSTMADIEDWHGWVVYLSSVDHLAPTVSALLES